MRKIFVIADSISIQYGPHLGQYLKDQLNYDRKGGSYGNLDDPEGANGGNSRQVIDYLATLEKNNIKLDILILNCGLHDIKKNLDNSRFISETEYEENLKLIKKTASIIASDVVWVTTTHVDTEIHNSKQKSFMRFAEDVPVYNKIASKIFYDNVIDLYSFTLKLNELPFADHVHFIPEVQKLQAAFIAGSLLNMFPV